MQYSCVWVCHLSCVLCERSFFWASMVITSLWALEKHPHLNQSQAAVWRPDFHFKFVLFKVRVWVGGCMCLWACALLWMEKRLNITKTQVCGLGVIPSHILCSISYLMAFLPCKSYQKIANNSITLTDTQASGEPQLWMLNLLWTTHLTENNCKRNSRSLCTGMCIFYLFFFYCLYARKR